MNRAPFAGPADLAVEVDGLRKTYGDHRVLEAVDLAVRTGSVIALLGPNGASNTPMLVAGYAWARSAYRRERRT